MLYKKKALTDKKPVCSRFTLTFERIVISHCKLAKNCSQKVARKSNLVFKVMKS